MASTQGPSMHHIQLDKVMEEYKDILSSPMGVPLYYQVNHSIDLNFDAPLPNGPIYCHSIIENEEIKCYF